VAGRRRPAAGLAGDDLPVGSRVARLTGIAVLFDTIGGVGMAVDAARRRGGDMLDPWMVGRFVDRAEALLGQVNATDPRALALAAEPRPVVTVAEDRLVEVAATFADLADLKSPFTHGHSGGVAALARRAGERLRLPPATVADLEVAGLLHDVGRVAVADVVWEKPGALSAHEWEQVRLHAYHSERILAGSERLTPLAPWSGCTTNGSTAAATTAAARARSSPCRPGSRCSKATPTSPTGPTPRWSPPWSGGSSAAAGVEGVKGLSVAEAGVGADGRVPGADPALQVGVVADLAGVGGHGGQLGVDGGGHVDQLVGGVGAEQQHGVGAVGGQALGAQRRCVERVAGGDHAVDGEQPGGAVVGVEQPAPPGVVAEDHVGPHGPDQAGHGQAQGHGDLELAVDRPQEVDRGHRPQGGRGRGGLGPAHRGQLGRVGPRVGAALLPGGEAGQLHVDPPPSPGGQGATGLELDVVRVGAERQRPPDGQH